MRTCSDVQRDLSRYIDDDLPPGEQAAVALHLASCEACRGIAADLRQIRASARTLGPVPPPEQVWSSLARLRHTTAASGEMADVRRRAMARSTQSWRWLGVAAALVVAVGAYIAVSMSRRAPAAALSDHAARAVSVQDVAEELDQALAHYERAVAGLETLARENGATMDPAVNTALQRNLAAIDRAIAESRTALVAEPQSASARASLADALRQKVDVLQTTVALVNEMRREHDNGAAGAGPGRQS
jgi:anti-sigma factor RsiW